MLISHGINDVKSARREGLLFGVLFIARLTLAVDQTTAS